MSDTSLLEARGACTVTGVDVAPAPALRLAELGVRGGARVEIVQRTSGGGVVVMVDRCHVALDRRTASLISVTPAPDEAP